MDRAPSRNIFWPDRQSSNIISNLSYITLNLNVYTRYKTHVYQSPKDYRKFYLLVFSSLLRQFVHGCLHILLRLIIVMCTANIDIDDKFVFYSTNCKKKSPYLWRGRLSLVSLSSESFRARKKVRRPYHAPSLGLNNVDAPCPDSPPPEF